MSNVKIEGNASGTGTFTIAAPNSNTDRSITLPDAAGELLLANGDGSNLTGISSYSDSDALDLFNATGSAPVYACRAWVNFKGTGTVAIRGSGNVSSITDGGAGNYTVNFTTAMPDTNYSVSGMAMQTNTSAAWARVININTPGSGSTADVKTTSIGIWVFKPSTEVSLDTEIVCLSIFR